MTVKIDLFISDLDNTLYDWVTFFASAFYEMVHVAAEILGTPEEVLLDECKEVHIRHHDSEQPFALLETATVRTRYGGLSRQAQAALLDKAFYAFNRARNEKLQLYPGVQEALKEISRRVPVVGHTEASAANAVFRLQKLGVAGLVKPLYALEGLGLDHPSPERLIKYDSYLRDVRFLGHHQRKPDVSVLLNICKDQGVSPERTLYIGDSIVRDIGMAKAAGVWAAWAEYGTKYDPELWNRLVRITHWTKEDVERAEQARKPIWGC
jgi:FMN phosphatase YigB (HAD superfamily)